MRLQGRGCDCPHHSLSSAPNATRCRGCLAHGLSLPSKRWSSPPDPCGPLLLRVPTVVLVQTVPEKESLSGRDGSGSFDNAPRGAVVDRVEVRGEIYVRRDGHAGLQEREVDRQLKSTPPTVWVEDETTINQSISITDQSFDERYKIVVSVRERHLLRRSRHQPCHQGVGHTGEIGDIDLLEATGAELRVGQRDGSSGVDRLDQPERRQTRAVACAVWSDLETLVEGHGIMSDCCGHGIGRAETSHARLSGPDGRPCFKPNGRPVVHSWIGTAALEVASQLHSRWGGPG